MRLIACVLVVLLGWLQYRLWIGDGSFRDVYRLEQSIEAQKQENASLRDRNETLEAEVVDLKQGLAAVEERARRELGMVRRDETFYQIVPEPQERDR